MPKATSSCGLEEPGIKPLIFQLVDNPLYCLSHRCPSISTSAFNTHYYFRSYSYIHNDILKRTTRVFSPGRRVRTPVPPDILSTSMDSYGHSVPFILQLRVLVGLAYVCTHQPHSKQQTVATLLSSG